ncbi:MAG: hypothetical protein RL077_1627 [Verrucomicrobiota bacterium]
MRLKERVRCSAQIKAWVKATGGWDKNADGSSNPQENFPAVHPPADEPEDEQGEAIARDRSVGPGEQAGTEVRLEQVPHPRSQKLRHEVNGDRVHANDDEELGPLAVTAHVDEPVEGGEERDDEAATAEGPRRGPDALDDRANRDPEEETGGGEQESGDEERLNLGLRR